MKILIADDSRLSRTTLKDALLNLNHEPIEAESGEEAITLFRSEHPDLVILDVVMGGMSGFECATRIRQLNKKDWIPIIFLSSSLDDEYILKGIEAGADDYLTKPFSKIVLSAKIKAMQRIADMRAELIDLTNRLNLLSSTDSLTGLNNRLQFDKKIIEAMALAARYQRHYTLFFIDIDHFKEVNDRFGHHVGDLLLKDIARRFTSCLRINDFIARLGGDEFAIILDPVKEIDAVARKIMESASKPFVFDGIEVPISYSIGITHITENDTDPRQVVGNADLAMYWVKKNGRNNYQMYSPELKGKI